MSPAKNGAAPGPGPAVFAAVPFRDGWPVYCPGFIAQVNCQGRCVIPRPRGEKLAEAPPAARGLPVDEKTGLATELEGRLAAPKIEFAAAAAASSGQSSARPNGACVRAGARARVRVCV